jgi:uncharacterized protein YegJ (DUF2314 family)/tetratricopeptide (TPR) repeat protein
MSEERFLSISDEYISCPHCNAQVPKKWEPQEDSVPEEAHHKMVAFSRRILNGGGVSREVVFALESLVRHYGPVEESNKALGLGYAAMGEKNKAEEFLKTAAQEFPDDREVLHCLLDLLFQRNKLDEVVQFGETLASLDPSGIGSGDVARLALAYTGMNDLEKAKTVLESYPHIDSKNPLVKKAKKALNRSEGSGIRSFLGKQGPLQRLLLEAGKGSLKTLSDRARSFVAGAGRNSHARPARQRQAETGSTAVSGTSPAVLEYWIYTPAKVIPTWDDLRTQLVDCCSGRSERQQMFRFLENAVEKNSLSIEYILRHESEALFLYPDELIPCNSRELSDEDRTTLAQAEMIVRLRLTHAETETGIDYLAFAAKFVETVRSLVNGVVQDAASHVLWGTEQWKKHVQQPSRLVETNLHFEILADEGIVWIHSHGMQKFGLPDVEMEGIPEDLAHRGRMVALTVAELLIKQRGEHSIETEVEIPGVPAILNLVPEAPDQEGHFPNGSLKIQFVPDSEGTSDDVRSILSSLSSRMSHASLGRRSEPSTDPVESENVPITLRRNMVEAHKRARQALPLFKTSFQQSIDSVEHVHAVKVGFPAQGGKYEWMWVTLDAWRGQSLVGHLESSPVLRKDLSKGSRVQITEAEIFDWVIVQSGDVLEGAYTENLPA